MTHNKDVAVNNSESEHNATPEQNKFVAQLHSQTQISNQRLDNLTTIILNKSVSSAEGIHPRMFCRRWFGLSAAKKNGRPRFTEEQILAMESEHGYREKCINLIAQVLKIEPNTIHRWGKGVAFNKIPINKRQKYQIYLGYVDAIRVITISLQELNEASLLRVLDELGKRQSERL